MQLADTGTIAKAIRDKYFHTLLPRSDEMDKTLKEILPDEESTRSQRGNQNGRNEGKRCPRKTRY